MLYLLVAVVAYLLGWVSCAIMSVNATQDRIDELAVEKARMLTNGLERELEEARQKLKEVA